MASMPPNRSGLTAAISTWVRVPGRPLMVKSDQSGAVGVSSRKFVQA